MPHGLTMSQIIGNLAQLLPKRVLITHPKELGRNFSSGGHGKWLWQVCQTPTSSQNSEGKRLHLPCNQSELKHYLLGAKFQELEFPFLEAGLP